MYYDDHTPPHFHARYAEHDAQIALADAEIIQGSLPRRAYALVREWVALHSDELAANWNRARAEQPLTTIEPLP